MRRRGIEPDDLRATHDPMCSPFTPLRIKVSEHSTTTLLTLSIHFRPYGYEITLVGSVTRDTKSEVSMLRT